MVSEAKIPAESPWAAGEVRERLQRGELPFAPAQIRLCDVQPVTASGLKPDGVLEAEWQGRTARFVFDYQGRSAPSYLESGMAQAERYGRELGLPPLVIVPYLSERSLLKLEAAGVSGLDLNGNGVLLAPDIALWRSGQPNRFKESRPIRNVFRGDSSLISRCFLLRPSFASLVELQKFALERLILRDASAGERLTKGTVSKVVQALEEERIIFRSKGGVQLNLARPLLDGLRSYYEAPRGKRIQGKTALPMSEAWERLRESGVRYVATGDGSAFRYRLLTEPPRLALYVEDAQKAASIMEVTPQRAFFNIDLIEEKGDIVYFDARPDGAARWASPVQTWLELSLGGGREREAAQPLEAILLKGKGETFQ
jgi:hypothetical protein